MAEEPLQAIIVLSENDGRKFKMVMRGSLAKLSVEKIKRYLAKSTLVEPEAQILTHNGRLLADDMLGEDFGLDVGDTLSLRYAAPTGASTNDVSGLRPDAVGRERQMDQHGHISPVPHNTGRKQAPETLDERLARMRTSQRGGASPSATTPRVHSSHLDANSLAAHNSSAQQYSGAPADSYGTPRQAQPSILRPDGDRTSAAQHPLMAKVTALEEENRHLREELERMRRTESKHAHLQPAQPSILVNARANLGELSKELGMHLAFDDNLCCVVGADEGSTIILTVDPPTERLYMYSTLSTTIPDDPVLRLRLFENVLEWAMLGRDMAGGGAGVCTRSGIVMMSTSIDLKHSDSGALRDAAPVFVESLTRWRAAAGAIAPPTNHH